MGHGAIDYIGVKGGLDINGIIEDYYAYAGENISAGDFVEFVNGVASSTTETSVDTPIIETDRYGNFLSACKIAENKVFIAHSSDSAHNYRMHGIVCVIDGTTITYGTDVEFSAGYAVSYITTTLLTNGNVLITYPDASYTLKATIVKISGTVITQGTDTQLVSANYSCNCSPVLLENGNVFIAYRNASVATLCGIVCTIDGTTITAGTINTLNSTTNSCLNAPSVALLGNGNVFIAHDYNDVNYYLYGMVCGISGTTITAGTDTQLSTASFTGSEKSAKLLPSGNVFIAHCYNSSNYYLYGMVCGISGTTITAGTDTQLSTRSYSGREIETTLLVNGDIFISHSDTNRYVLYAMIAKINGKTITHGTDTALSSTMYTASYISNVLLDDRVFVAHAHSSNFYLYAQIWGIDEENNIPTNNVTVSEYEIQVRPATTLPCDGVAKSSGEGGDSTGHNDMVSVYVNEV